jgi:hypothetical protein
MTHPGFAARRLIVQRRIVYVAQRVPGDPIDEGGVEKLSAEEVSRRLRLMPPVTLRRLHRREAKR